MNWLLDTNVVSELTRENPSAAVLAWLNERRGQCYLSTITLAELRYGVERLANSRRKKELDREFQFLMEDYQGRFLIWTATLPPNGDATRRNWKSTTARAGISNSTTGTPCWRRRRVNMIWVWPPATPGIFHFAPKWKPPLEHKTRPGNP